MKILKLQESKEYCRYVDLTLLFQSRQKRFLNFTIRVHLVGFSHMTVGGKKMKIRLEKPVAKALQSFRWQKTKTRTGIL